MVPSRKVSTIRGRVYLPVSSGHYSVGCVDLADKHIFFRLYYPHRFHDSIEDKETYLMSQMDRWPTWVPEPEYATAYVNKRSGMDCPQWMGRLGAWMACNPLCPIIQNASISDINKPSKFSIIIFSHGTGGCRTAYSLLCSEMASKGYVVAAIEHGDGTACIARQLDANGELMWCEPTRFEMGNYSVLNSQVCIRSRECKSAVDLLMNLNSGPRLNEISRPFDDKREFVMDEWRNRLDFGNGVSLCGHSFGGATVVKALQTYECFSSAFCFDAWLFPIHEEAGMLSKLCEKPLMFLNYEKCHYRSNFERLPIFEKKLKILDHSGSASLSSNVITIKEATHLTCTDIPTIFNGSYIKYPLGLFDMIGRMFTTPRYEGLAALSGEQGWSLSTDVYSSWLKCFYTSVENDCVDLIRTLEDNQRYFILGTEQTLNSCLDTSDYI